MIPKIIHYCWFGKNPLPDLAVKCINSWKKHLPDFEIICHNESDYNLKENTYAKEAYDKLTPEEQGQVTNADILTEAVEEFEKLKEAVQEADALMIGAGMVPRGEMALITAQIGFNEHVLGSEYYSTIIFIISLVTLVAPLLLKLTIRRVPGVGAVDGVAGETVATVGTTEASEISETSETSETVSAE